MFSSYIFSSLVFIALTVVDASPLGGANKGTLNFRSNIYEGGIPKIVERNRARTQALNRARQNGQLGASSVGIMNKGDLYVADVGVGSPPTNYKLAIDTGSSLTWVGAAKSYVKTKTSQDTGHSFQARYGPQNINVSGEEWIDTVTLSPTLVVPQQSIGVASQSEAFLASINVDGILGLGLVSQTKQEVEGVDSVPTVMDNLHSQGTISQEVLGVNFVPYCEDNGGGELTFGGYDESATISSVVYTPLTTPANVADYWSIKQSISYGSDTIMPSGAGVLDTGSTLVSLSSDAFQVYQSKTGATLDKTTGYYTLTQDQYDELQPLTFYIEGEPFVLTPNAQILPRSFTNGNIYLLVSDAGIPSNSEISFILGYTFHERYYTIYDETNQRVGFAATRYTNSTCN